MENGHTITAYFGAGCFWNSELVYSKQNGVKSTEVGFASFEIDDKSKRPRVEVVKVDFDPEVVSYDALVDVFWSTHNPEARNNSDPFYVEKSVLFATDTDQRKIANQKLESKKSSKDGEKYLTEVHDLTSYQKAPEKDQKYYMKN